MTEHLRRTGGSWWIPLPLRSEAIKVEGMTINPGEKVKVLTPGGDFIMTFRGWAHVPVGTYERYDKPFDGYWMEGEPGTGPGMWPGPYRIWQLRHPNLLEGLAREIDIDAAE